MNNSNCQCAAWVLGESSEPPDHVCPNVAAASTQAFLREHWLYPFAVELSERKLYPDGWAYIYEWPVPTNVETAIRWFLDWRAENGIILPPPRCFPVLSREFMDNSLNRLGTGWLALAVKRSKRASVWLLGWLKPLFVFRENMPVSVEGRTYGRTTSLMVNDIELTIENGLIKPKIPDNVRVEVLGRRTSQSSAYGLWRWEMPSVWIEGDPQTAGDLDALTKTYKTMFDWYMETLYGKRLRGRRSGSTMHFASREEFHRVVITTIRALKTENKYPSQRNVAEQLFPQNKDPLRELKRQCLYWGYTWETLRKDAESDFLSL